MFEMTYESAGFVSAIVIFGCAAGSHLKPYEPNSNDWHLCIRLEPTDCAKKLANDSRENLDFARRT